MNYSLYLFGTNKGKYIQYPSDGEESFLQPLCASTKGTLLTVHRKDSLTHYAFFRQLGSDLSQVFGICLVTNGVYIKDIKVLYQTFDKIFSRVVFNGKILILTGTGKISYVLDDFTSNKASIEQTEVLVHEIVKEDLEHYTTHTRQNFSGLIATKTIALEERNSEILRAIEQNNVVCIYTNDNANSSISYVEQTISRLYKENSRLRTDYSKLQSQKKQYRNVVILSLIVIICLSALFLFYNEVTNKSKHISELEQTISDKDLAITEKDNTIVGLEESLKELHSEVEEITSFTSVTGATIRNSDSHDNGWIMWLKAKQKVKIESFYVKGNTSGNVTIGLYDANDNLIASTEANVSNTEFRKINVGDDWIVDDGAYYMRIRSGMNLQYHSSNDKEYSQFYDGALIVAGCCSYDNRKKSDAKTNHSYYQYFYNIQYRIVI